LYFQAQESFLHCFLTKDTNSSQPSWRNPFHTVFLAADSYKEASQDNLKGDLPGFTIVFLQIPFK